ncbi:SH3 domain-containing protein [Durusdinium trenchii]|uniref:SH3 domain-containing protein n=1 Tax=Durusdinium trenchii TaxID=1381693 RepID=A0ABP0RTJ8_9DINO
MAKMASMTACAVVVAVLSGAGVASAQPTNFPTDSPVTQIPTAAPTFAVDLCVTEDEAVFEAAKDSFDFDYQVSGVACSISVLDGEEVAVCVRNQFADDSATRNNQLVAEPYTFNCAICFGRYTECMVEDCGCLGGRDQSDSCAGCSSSRCESPFSNCTGGFVIPPFVETKPLDTAQVALLAGASSGGVLLLALAVYLVSYRKPLKKFSAEELAEVMELEAQMYGKVADGDGDAASKKLKKEAQVAASDVPTAESLSAGGGKPPPIAPRRFEAEPVALDNLQEGRTYKMKMPFAGTGGDELTLPTNAKVELLEILDENWSEVKVTSSGKVGIVLSSYLAEL